MNMRRKWTIGQQIALGLAFPIVVLIALGAISYQSAQKFMETSRIVTSSYEARSRFDLFQMASVAAEDAAQAFLLTGRESDLDPYHTAVAGAENRYQQLRTDVTDPEELNTLEVLYEAHREQLRVLGKVIDVRRRDGLETASKLAGDEQYHTINASIRKNTDMVKKIEDDEIRLALQTFQAASDHLAIILVTGTAGTVLLVIAAGYLMIRGIDRQI